MSAKNFIIQSLQSLHGQLTDATADLSEAQINWWASEGGNPIAFMIWHFARTEDNLIQFALQRKPTIWMDQGFAERFGLDARAQGTGMSAEDAAKVRLPGGEAFLPYLKAVFQATEEFIAGQSDEDLEREIELRGLGKTSIQGIAGNTLMTHGYGHLGEIWYVRGLQGLKGSPI